MNLQDPKNWKYRSPEAPGLHEIISPDNSACALTWAYRLNLKDGQEYLLQHNEFEQNVVVIHAKLVIRYKGKDETLGKLDSFYIPGKESALLTAVGEVVLYIGASLYEGHGQFFIRKLDSSLSLGAIRQVHGKPPYQRDVFMTLAQEDEASRLICGITCGEPGMWTSWPPHQHTKDLEEVYCYFDIPSPQSAFHFSSRKSGEFEFVHPVSSGDFVIVPEGYHPTCGMPGVRSCYFWIMAAHKPESRRYDLAVNDPLFG